jgi:hypothetical protein
VSASADLSSEQSAQECPSVELHLAIHKLPAQKCDNRGVLLIGKVTSGPFTNCKVCMNTKPFFISIVMCASALFSAQPAAAQIMINDFTGPYELANWFPGGGGGGGSGTFSNHEWLTNSAPSAVGFFASASGLSAEASVGMTIDAVASGIWSFDWQYEGLAPDAFAPITGGFLLNDTFFSLASGGVSLSGRFSTNVSEGDMVGFLVVASGSDSPSATNSVTMTITGFTAPVPEPSTYALLVMSAAGALWWARRRKYKP